MRAVVFYPLLFFFIGKICESEGKNMDECKITPHKIYNCEDFENAIDIKIELVSTDDGGKIFNMDAVIDDLINEDYMVDLKVDRYVDRIWNENFYDGHESICSFIDDYLSKLWKNLREKIDPQVEEECVLPVGEYKLRNFEASSSDVDFPGSVSGTFRTRICLKNSEGECLLCTMTEGELAC